MTQLTNQATILRTLTKKEQSAGQHVMRQCMNVQQHESVVVVTDPLKKDKEAAIFFETAKSFSSNVLLVTMPLATEHAQEPPAEVASLMKNADVAFLVTTFSLSHTRARHEACDQGTRIASMPTITHEMILRTLTIDYTEIADLSKRVASAQTAGNNVHITSPHGTDITFSLSGRSAIADTGLFTNPGDSGNLPAGESFIAPVKGSANGIIVFDGCFDDIELDAPIRVRVKQGKAVDISGSEASRLLTERLARVGHEGSYNIAEFGIGTNKKAKLGNNLLEVEKVYGTCHIALGNNATFGGEVDVPFHSDGVILNPVIDIDGKIILQNKTFML